MSFLVLEPFGITPLYRSEMLLQPLYTQLSYPLRSKESHCLRLFTCKQSTLRMTLCFSLPKAMATEYMPPSPPTLLPLFVKAQPSRMIVKHSIHPTPWLPNAVISIWPFCAKYPSHGEHHVLVPCLVAFHHSGPNTPLRAMPHSTPEFSAFLHLQKLTSQ